MPCGQTAMGDDADCECDWHSVSKKPLRPPPTALGLLPALVGFRLAVAA